MMHAKEYGPAVCKYGRAAGGVCVPTHWSNYVMSALVRIPRVETGVVMDVARDVVRGRASWARIPGTLGVSKHLLFAGEI